MSATRCASLVAPLPKEIDRPHSLFPGYLILRDDKDSFYSGEGLAGIIELGSGEERYRRVLQVDEFGTLIERLRVSRPLVRFRHPRCRHERLRTIGTWSVRLKLKRCLRCAELAVAHQKSSHGSPEVGGGALGPVRRNQCQAHKCIRTAPLELGRETAGAGFVDFVKGVDTPVYLSA